MASINLPTSVKQDAIKTTVDGIDTKATTINTNLGTPTSGASSATSANAHAKLNYLLANSQVVKSIQRGRATISSVDPVRVVVNAVNMQKSMLNISTSTNGNDITSNAYGYLKSSTELEFKRENNSAAYTTAAWELVEFY